MPKVLELPIGAVADLLNAVSIGSPRNTNKDKFRIHVSDILETSGPRAFCPREQVLTYFSDRLKVGGKLTPGRRLLFARGEFEHSLIVRQFLRQSVYRGCVYAKWTCAQYRSDGEHDIDTTTFDKIQNRKCKCGRIMHTHNEIDLNLDDLMITGHPDMVLFHNGIYYIYEFKSIDRQDVSFDDIVSPIGSHEMQITFYYKIMKALGFNVSRRLIVMYVDRSNSKIWGGLPYKELPVAPVSDKFLQPFLNKLKHVKHGVATKKLPDRICPSIKHERAKVCAYCVECFGKRLDRVT